MPSSKISVVKWGHTLKQNHQR